MDQKYENLDNQILYAGVLKFLANSGLVLLFLTFFVYMLEIVEPLVPLEELPQYWNLPLHEFLEKTGAPTGWQWVNFLNKGDYLNFLGLVFFIGATGVCYAVLFFDFLWKKKGMYLFLVGTELIFIILAASNLLKVGH
ncbi:MAG: hypothetical protein HQM13_07030 [SAR324 cluster bacterium]|nr:hypothetical protein [SAR324 cluster bacterium]